MTATIEGNFWCCACLKRPFEILYHNPVTGRALLMAGSMLCGSSAPILARTKAVAKAYADEWNALVDNEASLLIAPRRIHITIELDAGKKKEAKDATQKT